MVAQKWQFQRNVIIDKLLTVSIEHASPPPPPLEDYEPCMFFIRTLNFHEV